MKKILVFTLLIALVTGSVFAEEKNAKEKVLELDPIVVTPSAFEERALDYPGSVSVITRKDIEESNAKYVYELLRMQPGIFVNDYTHVGKTVKVDLRGFGYTDGSNVLVLLDGRRLNEIDISGVDWAKIPIENVERIEIVRGAGSVLYGDNAAAGVVNIITRKGDGKSTIMAGYEGGSYRYYDFYGTVQGSHDFMRWNFFVKHEKTDGYRNNGDYEGYDYTADVTIFPADYLSMNFSAGYHKDWYGLPAGLQRWEIDDLGRRGSTTPEDRAKTETTYLMASPKLTFDVGGLENSVMLDAWGRKRRNNSTMSDGMGGLSFDHSQIDSAGGSLKYRMDMSRDRVKNSLNVGCDIFTAKNRLLTETPAWGTFNQLAIIKNTFGVFVSDKIIIADRFIAEGGFRQQWVKYVFNPLSEATPYASRKPEETAFDIGAEFKYNEGGALYARFSRSFVFPATDQFYSRWPWVGGLNVGLEHQTGNTWEIGIKEHNFRLLQVDAGIYLMNVENELFLDPTVTALGTNSNYDKTGRKGVELTVRSELNDQVDMFLSYTYTNAYFVGGMFAGNAIPMVPRHKINWGILLKLFDWLEFNFYSEAVGPRYTINDTRNQMAKLAGYMNCNAKLTLSYKGAEAFFGLNNVFNQKYSDIAVSNPLGTVIDYFPAPEINYTFGVSYKF